MSDSSLPLFFPPFFFADVDIDQGWGAPPALDTLAENDDDVSRPTSRRSSMSMDMGSRPIRGSVDESNARGGGRRSLDLSAPPGARQVLQQDFHSSGDKTNDNSTAKIEWSDIRNRSLSGYLA